MRLGEHAVARHRQFTAQVEQIMLHAQQQLRYRRRQIGQRAQQADHAVEFIHRADGLDARAVLGYAAAVTEAGGAFVTVRVMILLSRLPMDG